MNCGCTGCRDHLRLAFLSRSSGRRWQGQFILGLSAWRRDDTPVWV